jgi:sugar lactone lactonase YvrE
MKYAKSSSTPAVLLAALLVFLLAAGCSKKNSPKPVTSNNTTIPDFKIVAVFSGFVGPSCATFDATGNLYVVDAGASIIYKIDKSGQKTILAGSGKNGYADGIGKAASFYGPYYITVNTAGNFYVTDKGNELIRKITPTGLVTTIAGGNIDTGFYQYVLNGVGGKAGFFAMAGIAADVAGNLYVSDGDDLIRKITPDSLVSTFAGIFDRQGFVNGQCLKSEFNYPIGIAIDASGNMYVADSGNNLIRKISTSGQVSTFAGGGYSTTGYGDGTGTNASFNTPTGIAMDNLGNLYVSDVGDGSIRKITPQAVVTTIVPLGPFERPTGLAVDASNNLYVVDEQLGTVSEIQSQ